MEAGITPQRRIFVRCDIDVPLKNGEIQDTFRLDHLLPTLNYLKEKKAKIIIAGHMGRPKGFDETLSTKQLLPYFNRHLGKDCFELLENLRFESGEENNDREFAKKLAQKADIYVNESFATSHKKHASIVGLPLFLPSYAGLRFEEEVKNLQKVLENPQRPLVAVIGGAKIENKKPLASKFIEIADAVLAGGRIGLDWNDDKPVNLYIPLDYAENQLDIGGETIQMFTEILSQAKTIVWAGPMGKFEDEQFSTGTKALLEAVDQNKAAFSVAGGGDTVSAIRKLGKVDAFNFISTGGGSMLEFLAKGTLPGIEALCQKS